MRRFTRFLAVSMVGFTVLSSVNVSDVDAAASEIYADESAVTADAIDATADETADKNDVTETSDVSYDVIDTAAAYKTGVTEFSGESADVTVTSAIDKTDVASASEFTVSIPDGALIMGSSRQVKLSPATTEVKSYTSSDKTVIKISSTGKLTAVKAGTATITVTSKSGQKASLKLRVMPMKSDMVVSRTIDGKKALYRFKDGKLCKDKGFSTDGRTWFYCVNGTVSTKTGLFSGTVDKKKALWFVKNGRVQSGYSGGYRDSSDVLWFVQKGIVDKTLTGNFHANGKTYRVVNGKVLKSAAGRLDAFYNQTFSISVGGTKVVGREGVTIRLTNKYEASGWVDGIATVDGNEYYFGLAQEDGKYIYSPTEYNDKLAITCVKESNGKYYLKVNLKGDVKKPFKVSGRAANHYVTMDYEYLESENLIVFLPKGMHFDGNVMVRLEGYMAQVENAMGLKRRVVDPPFYTMQVIKKDFYGTDAFEDVDPFCKKVHVYIDASEEMSPECNAGYQGDEYNYLVIHEYDLDVNNKDYFFSTFMHEYAHYVHLTNYSSVSTIITEGVGAYYEEIAANKYMKLSDDKLYGERFYGYLILRGSVTASNAEQIFINDYRGARTDAYRYGCYFVKYLTDTYGRDKFFTFIKKATAELEKQQKADDSLEVLSGEDCAKLLKQNYSSNVFKDFAGWLNDHPEFTKTEDN
ncbi:MAG: Ig-like domain-containing protein [Eubacterium sp.]|nr:Ig-like domain-containing protein [Eubacterium sp.]